MKLADSFWHRVVQIVQEGIIEGVDVADLMRQVTVQPDASDPNVLIMTPEYEQQVKDMHKKLLEQAQELADKRGSEQIIDFNKKVN